MSLSNNFAHAAPGRVSPKSERGAATAIWVVMLIACLIQFTSAWIFPPSLDEKVIVDKAFGVPFQYALWATIMMATIVHIRNQGMDQLARVLTVFGPFILIALISGVFGISPIAAIRAPILWAIMGFAAVAIGFELPPQRTLYILTVTLLVLMLGSVLMAVAVPRIGAQVYGQGHVWRGLFTNKNQLGWVASISLMVGVATLGQQHRRISVLLILTSVACLIFSGSKGALVSTVVTVAYTFAVSRLARRVTPGFGVFVVLMAMLVVIVFAALAAPLILAALGRDMTLTGRTVVWQTYFNAMMSSPWIGEGPGAYTGLSELTAPLAYQLRFIADYVVTPHNSFLGAFGDSGIFGLCIFILMLLYLAVLVPMRTEGVYWKLSNSTAFLIIASGLVETHEIYSQGPGWFLLILSRALAMHNDQLLKKSSVHRASAVADGHA